MVGKKGNKSSNISFCRVLEWEQDTWVRLPLPCRVPRFTLARLLLVQHHWLVVRNRSKKHRINFPEKYPLYFCQLSWNNCDDVVYDSYIAGREQGEKLQGHRYIDWNRSTYCWFHGRCKQRRAGMFKATIAARKMGICY